jgi:hypothetical protein
MTMKPTTLALLLLTTVGLSIAQAQTYQWKDSNGRTIISDAPPPGNVRQSKTVSGGPVSEQGKSVAEREMEFKKRQQEAKEKADKDSKSNAAKADQQENCQRARQQLAALESGQRIANTDANGERRFMEDDERQKEIQRTRKIISEKCI